MDKLERILCEYMRRSLARDKPRLPEAGRDLIYAFNELSAARSYHQYGPNPISLQEFEAWCRLMQVPLRPHHVRALMAMDRIWIDDFYNKRDAAPDGVKKIPQVSEQPLTAALFDMAVS